MSSLASSEDLREKLHSLYTPFLKESQAVPSIRSARPSRVGEGVIDEATFQVLEVDKLFDTLNTASTVAGQATLYRSLAQPLSSADLIHVKQEALQELAANGEMRAKLEQLTARAAQREKHFYQLLFGTFTGFFGSSRRDREIEGYGYETYIKGTAFMRILVKDAQALPAPESDYLKILLQDLRQFASTAAYSLMRGPAYLTEGGVKAKEEKRWFVPALKFRPTLFKPFFIVVLVTVMVLLMKYAPLLLGFSGAAIPVFMLFLLPAFLLYIPLVGTFDRDGCIYPLRKRYQAEEGTYTVLEALGRIDELLCFYRYGKSFGHPTVLPRVIAAACHGLVLRDARNPILGKNNPAYIPNDIALGGSTHLTFITGPNSGGKTAFCKTIAQIHLLAQIGCYVPAEDAEVAVADRIFYQIPEISSLEDVEGRFGKELRRTKTIFLAATPQSLVILDELSEGTTYEEKLEISSHVLNGFHRIGNSTLLVTHNYEVAERFRSNHLGQHLQVEFIGENPTYRVKEGISKVSHADRVARKIGFAKEDIERYLRERGFG
jgi:DNA mismatch repair protein MutS